MTEIEIIKMVMLNSGNQYAQDKLSNYFSKWGISARSHSHIPIRNLTEVEAIALHKKDFWDFYRMKDLPPKIRATVYTIGIILGFPESFKLLSQAAEYFPLRESPTDELLSVVDSKNPETIRARMGSLFVLWLYDHGQLQTNVRSLIPRIMEAVSLG